MGEDPSFIKNIFHKTHHLLHRKNNMIASNREHSGYCIGL